MSIVLVPSDMLNCVEKLQASRSNVAIDVPIAAELVLLQWSQSFVDPSPVRGGGIEVSTSKFGQSVFQVIGTEIRL